MKYWWIPLLCLALAGLSWFLFESRVVPFVFLPFCFIWVGGGKDKH